MGNLDLSQVGLPPEPAFCPPPYVASGNAGKIKSSPLLSFLLSDNFQKIKYEQRQWEDAVELIPSKSGHLVSDHPSLGKAKESWLLTTYFLFYLKKNSKYFHLRQLK